ncbi:MAG: hypothetical protein ACYCYO_20270 [Bacilli bacterium]
MTHDAGRVTGAKNPLGANWLDEIETRHAHAAKDGKRLLTTLRTAIEELDEIGQGTAGATGYDHVLARLARTALATIETIREGGDGV